MRNLSISILGLLLLTCNSKEVPRRPGICLSFDDRSVHEWFHLRNFFNEHKVKVTFFITQPDSLSDEEVNQLRILEKDGHEIGFHGTMHVSSEDYIAKKSYPEYLAKEIDQGIRSMDSLGFKCSSFAYPYGSKYWFTDFLLSKKFESIRGVSPVNKEKDLAKMDEIYYSYDHDKTLSAVGIDIISGIDEAMIDRALKRALNNKEVLLLYAHKPANSEQHEPYSFSVELLYYLAQKASENNINFYTMRELKATSCCTDETSPDLPLQ